MFRLCLISTAEAGLFESQNIFRGSCWVCSFCLHEDVCLLSGSHSVDSFCFPKPLPDVRMHDAAHLPSAALCIHTETYFEGWAGVSQGESKEPDALQNTKDVVIRKKQQCNGWGCAKHLAQFPELSVTLSVSSSSTPVLLGYLSTEWKWYCSRGEIEFNINTISCGKARVSQSWIGFVLYTKSFILQGNSKHSAVNLMLPTRVAV